MTDKKRTIYELMKETEPKLSFANLVDFTNLILESPEIIDVVKKQFSWRSMTDKEVEENESVLTMFAMRYLKARGESHQLCGAYKLAYRIVGLIIKGEIESARSDEARKSIESSDLIDFSGE